MLAITPEVKEILKEQVKNFPQLGEKQKAAMLEQIDAGGATLKELMGIQPAFIEFTYRQAQKAYEMRDLKKAYSLFHFLNLLDGSDPRFMMGIGATAQLKEDYMNAQYWYLMADRFLDHDPMVACYLSECFGKTDQPLQKKFFLEIAQERCNKDPRYDPLKERIGMMLKGMEDIQ